MAHTIGMNTFVNSLTDECVTALHQLKSHTPLPLQKLDVFMAGDDVPEKKPDPSIYRIAAERLQLSPAECLVVEDSTIGLRVGVHAPQSDASTPAMCCSDVTADIAVRMRVQHSKYSFTAACHAARLVTKGTCRSPCSQPSAQTCGASSHTPRRRRRKPLRAPSTSFVSFNPVASQATADQVVAVYGPVMRLPTRHAVFGA